MRKHRRYSKTLLLGLCPMLFIAVSCSDQGARELAVPIFDARAPFAELSSSGKSSSRSGAKSSGQSSGASDFEKAIAESMAGGGDEDGDEDSSDSGDAQDDAPSSAAVQTQKVALPGGLASSIPLDFDTWQWTSENGVTVITHREAGATSPDAMIYAERFSDLVRMYPSQEMARFRVFADPAFAPLVEVLNPAQDLIEVGDESSKPAPTLDYRSSRDSFSGWTWFGQNDADVTLRFGRTQGRWSAPEVGGEGEDSSVTSSAWMLLGSANLGGNLGTHIAIICKRAPQCPVADELSEFLAEIAPAGGGL